EHTGVAAWDAHRIKAVIASRARGATRSGAQEPTSLRLLRTLIELDLEDARHFVGALKQAGVAPSVLVDEAPSAAALTTFQKLLTPAAGSGLARPLECVT